MEVEKIEFPLKLQNGNNLYFNLSNKLKEDILGVFRLYENLPIYSSGKKYRDNIIRVTLSDIDIENALETSTIESLSAIFCRNIKNKNQKTALNLLNMLESGVLNESAELSHGYVKRLWGQLTEGNRNILAFNYDYRKSSVVIRRRGKTLLNSKKVYTAPNHNDVPILMSDLYNFINNGVIIDSFYINSFLKSIIFSAYFVYVHPFLDGNGRVSRLLLNKLLIDMGLVKFKYISVNSEISKNKSEYAKRLEEIENEKTGDITKYIEYMVSVFNSLMMRLLVKDSMDRDFEKLSSRQKRMLLMIKIQNSGIHIKMYKQLWNQIAVENNLKKINVSESEKDLIFMFEMGFIVYDERYTLYPGFKYYNK